MFGKKGRRLLPGVVISFALALSACSGADGGNGGDDGTPQPAPTTFAATPVEGGVPAQQAQIAGSGPAKLAYPTITERGQVLTYVRESVRINMNAIKSRQPFEVEPKVVGVKGSTPCYQVPGARRRVAVYKVGDKAPSASPLIASCVKDGKLVLMVAANKFYQFHLDYNVPEVRATVIYATQEYLAQLARNRAGGREDYYAECAGGRLFGGLRDAGYVPVQWAGIQGIDGEVDTDAERIITDAREQGMCPNGAFGTPY